MCPTRTFVRVTRCQCGVGSLVAVACGWLISALIVMLADLRTEAQVLSIATRKIVFPAPYKRNLL